MDTVTILRDLWRLRALVATVLLFAVMVGIVTSYRIVLPPQIESRRYELGVATARILVDTPSSQVVEVSPEGADSLGVRANLLASLMVDGVVKSAIARRAGLAPSKLIGVTEAASDPSPVSKPPTPRDFVLTTRVVTNAGGAQLPIVEVETQAPTRVGAGRLASAAVEGLRDYLDSTAAQQRVKDADRLHLTGLGAPQASSIVRGPAPLIGLVVSLFVFVLGCAAIVAGQALVRAWRAASAREAEGAAEADGSQDEGIFAGELLASDAEEGQAPTATTPPPDDDWLERDRPAGAARA